MKEINPKFHMVSWEQTGIDLDRTGESLALLLKIAGLLIVVMTGLIMLFGSLQTATLLWAALALLQGFILLSASKFVRLLAQAVMALLDIQLLAWRSQNPPPAAPGVQPPTPENPSDPAPTGPLAL